MELLVQYVEPLDGMSDLGDDIFLILARALPLLSMATRTCSDIYMYENGVDRIM